VKLYFGAELRTEGPKQAIHLIHQLKLAAFWCAGIIILASFFDKTKKKIHNFFGGVK